MNVGSPSDFPAAFAAAWTARDASALAQLFVEDADFVNVVGIWWRDRAAIEAAHDYGLRSFFAGSTLTPGRTEVRMLGEGHATVHCRFRLIGQRAPDGATAGPRTTILLFVLERRAGGWLCVAAQNTEVVPGAETWVAGADGLAARDYR